MKAGVYMGTTEQPLVSVQDFVLEHYDAKFLAYFEKLCPAVLKSELPAEDMRKYISSVRELYMQRDILQIVRDAFLGIRNDQ